MHISYITKRFTKELKKTIMNYHLRLLTPYRMRNDDVYLVSFPKSGNTWLSFLIANVITRKAGLDVEVNFFNLHSFVPDIQETRYVAEYLLPSPLWRFIKSHSAYNPYYKQVIFLVRDPRDVMISYYRFMFDGFGYKGSLSEFIRNSNYGIITWLKHTESWFVGLPYPTARFRIIRFEDLKYDALKELSSLVNHMGLKVEDAILERAVEMSSFDRMKKLEMETVTDILGKRGKYSHVRSGEAGQFNKELCDNDLEYIERIAGRYIKLLGY